MITVAVDAASPVPPFEQLRAQLADAIRSGAVDPGTRLPTVRQLAADLGLAPNTVARAYRSLEDDGLVRADGRRGTRVAEGQRLSRDERDRLLTDAARRYLDEARRLGATPAAAQERLAGLGRSAPLAPGSGPPPSPAGGEVGRAAPGRPAGRPAVPTEPSSTGGGAAGP